MERTKWYKTNFGVIAMLFIFFPVGLYLMWKHANWNKNVKIGISVVFALLVLGAGSQDSNTESNTSQTTTAVSAPRATEVPKPTVEPQHELDVDVKLNELAFMITNNEETDWKDCKLEINSGIISSGYVYRAQVMPKKDSLIVEFREFTKKDGTRFDSYSTKPQSLSIFCSDVAGKYGSSYFGTK